MPIEDKVGMTSDSSAILMMLAYVEAECRRLGAEAAAQHAAMAAALVTRPGSAAVVAVRRGVLH